jgi:hypothetical protein
MKKSIFGLQQKLFFSGKKVPATAFVLVAGGRAHLTLMPYGYRNPKKPKTARTQTKKVRGDKQN